MMYLMIYFLILIGCRICCLKEIKSAWYFSFHNISDDSEIFRIFYLYTSQGYNVWYYYPFFVFFPYFLYLFPDLFFTDKSNEFPAWWTGSIDSFTLHIYSSLLLNYFWYIWQGFNLNYENITYCTLSISSLFSQQPTWSSLYAFFVHINTSHLCMDLFSIVFLLLCSMIFENIFFIFKRNLSLFFDQSSFWVFLFLEGGFDVQEFLFKNWYS